MFLPGLSGIGTIGSGSVKVNVNLAFINSNTKILDDIQAAIDDNLVETVDGRSLGGLQLVNDKSPITARLVRQIPGKF